MTIDFHSLYERYAPAVRRFALFLSGDAAAADDITSETFVRAWTSFGKSREQTVKAYLFTIARNLYRDMLRRDRRLSTLDESMPDPRPDVSSRVERSSELATVFAAIRELPEIDRTALLMRGPGSSVRQPLDSRSACHSGSDQWLRGGSPMAFR